MKLFGFVWGVILFLISGLGYTMPEGSTHPAKRNKKVVRHLDPIQIGFLDTYDSLPVLEYTEIDGFLNVNTPQDLIDSEYKLDRNNKSTFNIETSQRIFRFNKKGNHWFEFLGYYSGLNCYAISENHRTEGLELGNLCLVDSISGKSYEIVSVSDWRVENPIVSENKRFMVYFNNELVGQKSTFLGVLKINAENRHKQLFSEFCSFRSDSFFINEIRWEGDSVLYIDATDLNGNQIYQKAQLPN